MSNNELQPWALFDSGELVGKVVKYPRSKRVFAQGDPATQIFYLRQGVVKLSVLSTTGKEAIVGLLTSGEFFGEACLAGQARRMMAAVTMMPSAVIVIDKSDMLDMLHRHPQLFKEFVHHLLVRNIRTQEDLIDQFFNSVEKRLARILLLLAPLGANEASAQTLPKVSQSELADMIGTTRGRVSLFMNRFRKAGFIDYGRRITINRRLLSSVIEG